MGRSTSTRPAPITPPRGFRRSTFNTTGSNDTASGYQALYSNTTGNSNTASGVEALLDNTTGSYNTASGLAALVANTTGNDNTASGYSALYANTIGIQNSAVGRDALHGNVSGNNNLAFGFQALYSNVSGSYNTAVGTYALVNATGDANNAQGYSALFNTTTGSVNTAQGYQALYSNTTGTRNIGIGNQAGYYQTTGSYNIYIGNYGATLESGVIRIGDPNAQSAAYLAGVSRTNITGGTSVVVNASGQLGVASSSRRYKQDIEPMAGASERLLKLRPVSFHYKQPSAAGERPVQYGLIAEEVAEVFPELVVNNSAGRPEAVAYQVLPSLLLNELQKEHALNQRHTAELGELKQQLAQLQAVNRAMQVALRALQSREPPVARR